MKAKSRRPRETYGLVVVGGSLGGLSALQVVLSALPADFSAPVVVVLHRDSQSDDTLMRMIQKSSVLPVREAEDKERLCAGTVFVAPADYHLLIEGRHLALSTEPPVAFARPSIDVLFESTVDACGAAVVGVILSGANADGSLGLASIRAAGGLAVAQDPATAEAPAMPAAAIQSGADEILPPDRIGPFLVSRVCPGGR